MSNLEAFAHHLPCAERKVRLGRVKTHKVIQLVSGGFQAWCIVCRDSWLTLVGQGSLGAYQVAGGTEEVLLRRGSPEQPAGFREACGEGFGKQLVGSPLVCGDGLVSVRSLGQVSAGCCRLRAGRALRCRPV